MDLGLVFGGACGGWVDVLRVYSSFSNTCFLEKGLSCPPFVFFIGGEFLKRAHLFHGIRVEVSHRVSLLEGIGDIRLRKYIGAWGLKRE